MCKIFRKGEGIVEIDTQNNALYFLNKNIGIITHTINNKKNKKLDYKMGLHTPIFASDIVSERLEKDFENRLELDEEY